MSHEVLLAALGADVTEATVTRWLCSPGEAIEAGQPLVEVATDKVDTEIVAPATGVLVEVAAAEGATVQTGALLAVISPREPAVGTGASEGVFTPNPAGQPDSPTTGRRPATGPSAGASDDGPFLTPVVRRLFEAAGIDPSQVAGTGRGGRVTRRDAEAHLANKAKRTLPGTATPPAVVQATSTHRTSRLSNRRSIIAQRMLSSLQTSAQLTTVVEVDMTHVQRQRAAHNLNPTAASQRVSSLAFVAHACCRALAAHPVLNASLDTQAGTVTYYDHVALGIAVDSERGLLVPVIPSAHELNVQALARHIAVAAQQAREGSLAPDRLTGGTFTITNTGSRGSLIDTPILNSPQVGILGLGAIVKRPVVTTSDGADLISIRPMAYLCLTYDHQLVDGADAARFLGAIKEQLESTNDSGRAH
jgi:2-oxoglutarate dehydrogenase E2 component (dihydrolipoamide succinyltransferase)